MIHEKSLRVMRLKMPAWAATKVRVKARERSPGLRPKQQMNYRYVVSDKCTVAGITDVLPVSVSTAGCILGYR